MGPESDRRDGLLRAILIAAVLVSIVHYADNTINLEDFPGPGWIQEWTIVAAWLLLTPFALLGYRLYRRRRVVPAAACLAVYSISGLISLGHYTYGFDLGFWHQLTVIGDLVLGSAVLAFAYWAVRSFGPASRRPSSS